MTQHKHDSTENWWFQLSNLDSSLVWCGPLLWRWLLCILNYYYVHVCFGLSISFASWPWVTCFRFLVWDIIHLLTFGLMWVCFRFPIQNLTKLEQYKENHIFISLLCWRNHPRFAHVNVWVKSCFWVETKETETYHNIDLSLFQRR